MAGINIGGGYATFPGVIGTAVTKVGALEVARTGLGETEAAQAGFVTDAVISESTTRAGYYPGAAPITTKLVVERGTGRLLGAQIVGEEGAAKRIDAPALAVWNGMTVDELLGVDLVCAAVLAGLGSVADCRWAGGGPAFGAAIHTAANFDKKRLQRQLFQGARVT